MFFEILDFLPYYLCVLFTICIISKHLFNYSVQNYEDVPLANKNRTSPNIQLKLYEIICIPSHCRIQYNTYTASMYVRMYVCISFKFKTCELLSLDVYY